ncbi:hypothetical protein AVEN_133012-1 [Araneus ventricosus]|uniref:Uncharacterized protein n=1 Tax=Araneus ventricosus TaxID=182803 RepID=A0A4Y2LJ92_ARAVE|nr:hypothetical protein AVEN_133012-1 [Araneus ventricosus]
MQTITDLPILPMRGDPVVLFPSTWSVNTQRQRLLYRPTQAQQQCSTWACPGWLPRHGSCCPGSRGREEMPFQGHAHPEFFASGRIRTHRNLSHQTGQGTSPNPAKWQGSLRAILGWTSRRGISRVRAN